MRRIVAASALLSGDVAVPFIRRRGLILLTFVLVALPHAAFAQSPWERAATNLELSFTGPLARPRRRRHRWAPLHVRRAGGQAADLGNRLRRWTRALRRSVPRVVVLSRAVHNGILVTNQPTYRAVHKALHRPLTVCGVDRRL